MSTHELEAYEAPGGVQILGSAVDTSIAQLEAHARAMSTAHKLASAMCNTDLVPKMYKGNAENGTAAILYGMELGLNPIQSLQNIFVVHGQPAIYARTMVALVKSKGYQVWTVETSDESVTVSGRAPGDEHVTTSTWTIERAVKAGYVPQIDPKTGEFALNKWGKLIGNEKYLTDPQAMLYAKAASEVSRKIAPEVLLGLAHSAEDLQSEPAPVQTESSRASEPVKAAGWQDRLGIKASEPVAEKKPEPEAKDTPAPEPEPVKDETPEPPKAEPKKRAPATKTQAKPAEKSEPVKASEPSSDVAKEDTAEVKPSYTIPKDAATPEQLAELGRLLDAENAKTPEAKLEWINQSFTTAYINARQVTTKQAADAIKYLSAPSEDEK